MSALTETMASKLVEQWNHEIGNFEKYKVRASFFNSKGLTNISKFFDKQADDELKHASIILKYLCDKNYTTSNMPKSDDSFKDKFDAFKTSLELELLTTKKLKLITKLALEIDDFETFFWISDLIKEQTEEENTFSLIINRLSCDSVNWNDLDMWILEEFLK